MPQSTADRPASAATAPFKEHWTSLRQHRTPDWLADAKFGIYCHWGINTIWYQPEYADLSAEEAVDKWTADAFDPDGWAELFQRAGARFGGPIALHSEPFPYWDSALTDFNCVKRNPHTDILGRVSDALKRRGLKVMTSFHQCNDTTCFARAREVIDKYLPDLLWFDASFGGTKAAHHQKILKHSRFLGTTDQTQDEPDLGGGDPQAHIEQVSDREQRKLLAYYYNRAAEAGRDVEVVYKSHDLPPGVAMRDLENGLMPDTAYDVWMSDIDITVVPDWKTHGWFYREGIPFRSAGNIVHLLADITSKNGILLLNVPPKADGSFTDETHRTLGQVGDWLQTHGEAIYSTAPWCYSGEGPTEIGTWTDVLHHNDHFGKIRFTPEDIRFTTRDDKLYAICLGPIANQVHIRAFSTDHRLMAGQAKHVELVGSDAPLDWQHTPHGMTITLPDSVTPDPLASVFRVTVD
ncbi:MAG: alpha-L-fucosidase [Planctomycetota bacterium]